MSIWRSLSAQKYHELMAGIRKPKRIAQVHFDISMDAKDALGFFYRKISDSPSHAALFMGIPLVRDDPAQMFLLFWFQADDSTVYAEPVPCYLAGIKSLPSL